MNKQRKRKAIVLSLGLAALMLTANNLNAQSGGSRGIFDRGFEASESTRDGGGMEWQGGGMTPQNPTEEAPLGSGLMLLMAAGAGYAALKRKEE